MIKLKGTSGENEKLAHTNVIKFPPFSLKIFFYRGKNKRRRIFFLLQSLSRDKNISFVHKMEKIFFSHSFEAF